MDYLIGAVIGVGIGFAIGFPWGYRKGKLFCDDMIRNAMSITKRELMKLILSRIWGKPASSIPDHRY